MSGGEIIIIMLALLLLFGSKNLPSIARNLGKSMETFRKATRDVTDEIMRADIDKDPPPARKAPPQELASAEENPLSVKPSAQAVERNDSDRA